MATRKKVEASSDDVYMSKYDKISEEKFEELEKRIAALEAIASPGAEDAIVARLAQLEKFEADAKSLKNWWPHKWD